METRTTQEEGRLTGTRLFLHTRRRSLERRAEMIECHGDKGKIRHSAVSNVLTHGKKRGPIESSHLFITQTSLKMLLEAPRAKILTAQ